MQKVGVHVNFNGTNTVKELLVALKDTDSICNKGGVIYRYQCNQPGCIIENIGETGRIFGDRYKEYSGLPPPSLTIPKLQDTSSN